jgi:hypothetical protein
MAVLTLEIGPLSSYIEVTNARAQNVLVAIFDLHHIPEDPPVEYTNQEKLDWITQVFIPQMLTAESRRQHERLAVAAASEEFEDDDARFE